MEAIPRKLKQGKIPYDGYVPQLTTAELYEADTTGFCLRCGEFEDGCEPDARHYLCAACGERSVYGVATLVEMGLAKVIEDKATDALYADVTSAMRAEMHRGFVAMQMFCVCGAVLDCHKSVCLDVIRTADKKMAESKIICLTCWDGIVGDAIRKDTEKWGDRYLEVYNGKTGEVKTYPEERNNEAEQASFNLEVGHEKESTV